MMTEDHSIWHSVYCGMRPLVPTTSSSPHSCGLSVSDLRQKVVTGCHLDQRWCRQDQTPTKSETTSWHPRTLEAKLLPGGEWVLSLRTNGELHIQRPGEPTSAFVVPGPDVEFEYVKMRWFPSEDGNRSNLVTLVMSSWDKRYVNTSGILLILQTIQDDLVCSG
jgi:hypothetical protein